ncbi:meiosis protein MEI2 [Cordyceps fumosorosea ARSEF 2679]|uniref:Meiosis protein MEI2 n=1 Tax=Cordyceps fumosorosea (strain ARSEF 2679) TaxID=1081104 RepID=A0A167MIR3_CORFA|nr:meiosis protein MEI2 [Cordyceps fumosorosea ARSEF 2679]OAA54407.1 meiosis protein MEI2 [Cordyceps fumosorosea ARSEF 2679]
MSSLRSRSVFGFRVFHGANRILERKGTVGVFFEDIRDAWLFQSQTSSSKLDWQVVLDSAAELYPLPRDSGQLVVLATVPPGSAASAEQVAAEVTTNLRVHGEIFAFEKKMTYRDGSFRGVVEYCDVLAAKTALAQAQTSAGQSHIGKKTQLQPAMVCGSVILLASPAQARAGNTGLLPRNRARFPTQIFA